MYISIIPIEVTKEMEFAAVEIFAFRNFNTESHNAFANIADTIEERLLAVIFYVHANKLVANGTYHPYHECILARNFTTSHLLPEGADHVGIVVSVLRLCFQ